MSYPLCHIRYVIWTVWNASCFISKGLFCSYCSPKWKAEWVLALLYSLSGVLVMADCLRKRHHIFEVNSRLRSTFHKHHNTWLRKGGNPCIRQNPCLFCFSLPLSICANSMQTRWQQIRVEKSLMKSRQWLYRFLTWLLDQYSERLNSQVDNHIWYP